MTKNCLTCGKEFERPPKVMEIQWAKRKYCSMVCSMARRRAWVSRG